MQKSITTIISEIKEDLRSLINAKKSLYMLTAYEKAVPISIKAVYAIILMALSFFLITFLLITGGLALGLLFVQEAGYQTLLSITLGFSSLSGILLLVLLFLLIIKGVVTRSIKNKILTNILNKIDQEEAKKAEEKQSTVVIAEEMSENNDTQKLNPVRYEK